MSGPTPPEPDRPDRLVRTGWAGHRDAALLCALALGDPDALRELHRRFAPHLLALARHHGASNAEKAVQDAFVLIARHAHCHARTSLDARTWVFAVARHAWTRPAASA